MVGAALGMLNGYVCMYVRSSMFLFTRAGAQVARTLLRTEYSTVSLWAGLYPFRAIRICFMGPAVAVTNMLSQDVISPSGG